MKSAILPLAAALILTFTSTTVDCWFQNSGSGSAGFPQIQFSFPEISGDLFSTLRILARLCFGSNVNDTIAKEFWDCYNVTGEGGAEIFETCQSQVFGFLVNSGENVQRLCRSFYKLPMYAGCVVTGFNNSTTTLDMGTTFDLVNKCEAEVLGIGGSTNINSTDIVGIININTGNSTGL